MGNIKKLLDGVGIDCDSEKAAIIVKELAGKNLEELIAEGNGKLASVPSGGAAPLLQLVAQPLLQPLPPLKRSRKKSLLKNPTTIWDSVSLIKKPYFFVLKLCENTTATGFGTNE